MENRVSKLPIVLAVSGASGFIYAISALQFLLQSNYSVDLVVSDSAIRVANEEEGIIFSSSPSMLREEMLSEVNSEGSVNANLLRVHEISDIGANIASGSYKTQGMIILPCSMGTLSAIAHGTSDNLITRAADVCMKERRKLVLVPREMPLSTLHLENMLKLSKLGVVIAPASPAFYNKPKSLNDSINFVLGKIFDSFGLENELFNRWKVGSLS